MKFILAVCASLFFAGTALAQNPRVELKTSRGPIVVELYADKAPKTVENFLGYVKAGFYDGTIFHRVIDGFMIQGGGFDRSMKEKPTRGTIQNEAGNRLPNQTGTLAMARRPDPHSASAQFFINLKDNDFLNYRDASPQGYGYAVFGKVVRGMEVVNNIAKASTGTVGPFENVPREPIVIQAATVVPAGN
jgi:cyclophilin family peptidyl-prolyl cis-trans isomerase